MRSTTAEFVPRWGIIHISALICSKWLKLCHNRSLCRLKAQWTSKICNTFAVKRKYTSVPCEVTLTTCRLVLFLVYILIPRCKKTNTILLVQAAHNLYNMYSCIFSWFYHFQIYFQFYFKLRHFLQCFDKELGWMAAQCGTHSLGWMWSCMSECVTKISALVSPRRQPRWFTPLCCALHS